MCTTSHVKALTFEETFDFQTKLLRMKEVGLSVWTRKTERCSENKLKEDKDRVLESEIERDKCTKVSADISLSRRAISTLVRLQ